MMKNAETAVAQPTQCHCWNLRLSNQRLSLFALITLLLTISGAATATTVDVEVGGGLFFTPDNVTISTGDTVRWTWIDDEPHTVTSGANGTFDNLFDSGLQTSGFIFTYTFTSPGTFEYFCRPHYSMGMVGTVNVVQSAGSSTLGNISTRLRVETGDNALIGGFIITGTQPKRVIVRAIGPSLPFSGTLTDTILELHGPLGFTTITNDNWRSDQEAEIIATTIPPTNDLESAIVANLPSNSAAYTAIVRGVNNGTGIGLVEAYDLDTSVDSKLANISTRGLVETDDNVLIAGTIVVGGSSQRVLVRAIGPSLPVSGKLEDPTLELRDANGAGVRSNDNWRSDQEAEIIATTIPPTNDLESALIETLSASPYTAIVRGVNNITGVALVEIYALN